MKVLGNILWFLTGGILTGLFWTLFGCLWCITIVGIPVGLQCFKFAELSFFPFNKEVDYGGHAGSLVLNILWILVTGAEMAAAHTIIGGLLCLSILGIPFGKQHFKIAKASLWPFGTNIKNKEKTNSPDNM